MIKVKYLFCALLLVTIQIGPATADEISNIPPAYKGAWRGYDTAIVAAIVSDRAVVLIDEYKKRKYCKASSISTYKAGFFSRKVVVRVNCERSDPREVRDLNYIFGTDYRPDQTKWTVYLTKQDDVLDINDCLEPFEPCSRPIGIFYKNH